MAYPETTIAFLKDPAARCKACGADAPPSARFCRRCGRPLEVPGGEPCKVDPQRAEHKQVTVLFADVQGSMALSERLDPEDWYRIVTGFFVILAEGVQRVGGVVNRFTGDGIMALFGAPVAQEDHAQRACFAALRLRQALDRYSAELRETRGIDLAVRIGIHSGDVVAATLGRQGSAGYTALGQTVHLAAEMERIAEPGRIFISERTASLVEGYFRLVDRGPRGARGAGLHAYELIGIGAYHSRLDRSREHGLLRFVGRSNEMRALERALDDARAGRGAILGVRGEIGVGKSRLCHEFLAQAEAAGVAVYRWHIVSHLRATPFLSLIMALRRMFAVGRDDPAEMVRRRIASRLAQLGGDAPAAAPFFERLLGVAADGQPATDSGDPERMKLVLASFMRSLGQQRPAVMLIEDPHWIDSASGKLLELALEAVPGTRVMVLMNFRPEYRAPRSPIYREIELPPLGRRAMHELLRQLLGDDPMLDGLAEEIRERCGGNPFFMEELVTMLAETGALLGVRGAYRPGPRRAEAVLPSSLQALLESRIDLLPSRQKDVLQTAAVIGRRFSLPLLRRVMSLPEEAVDDAILALQEAGFITGCEPSDEVHFAFRHPLMQEQAYRVQVKEDLAAAHADVARVCAEIYADRLDERASLIAHHWECAGNCVEAAHWAQRAAAWIGQRNLAEGLRSWRKVFALLDRAPASAETDAMGVVARAKVLELGGRLGMPSRESAQLFAEAKTRAERLGDPRPLALLYVAYGSARGFVGEVEDACALTREAVRFADQSRDPRLMVRLRVALTYSLITAGHFNEARELCERLLGEAAAAPNVGSARHLAYLHFFHAMICVDTGRPLEARADLELAADAAWEHADVEILSQIYAFAPVVARILGDGEQESLVKAQRAVELAEYLGNPFGRVFAYWGLGNAHLLCGDAKTASRVLNGVLLLARDQGVGLQGEAGMLAELAAATLVRGDGAVALSIAEEAVQVAIRRRTRLYEVIAQLSRAWVLVETVGAAAAIEIESCLGRVLEICAADGTRSFVPLARFHSATLAEKLGDAARAARELERAREGFAAMGAAGWVARIDRRIAAQAAA